MKTRRQRMLLTAAAIAGSVALYGCGGGESGPDKTPFNQTDVDKAAADAKKKAEMEAAAAATAMAEAGAAAAEAKKAMNAAAAAKTAADDAAKYAMTATLDMAKAMAASANASEESGKASAAAKAARAAAAKASTAASGHKAAMDAETSAKAAERHAMEAAASAAAAKRSYETAKSVKADRDATGDLAAAAGTHAETARQQAEAAAKAAMDAMAEVAKAKAATTKKAAEDARKAATTARDAAKTAYEMAAAAAEKIESDAAAVAMEKTDAEKYAKAAKASRDDAQMYFDRTAGYADARKARDEANDGKADLGRHADLRMRVPWIAATTTKNAMTEIENAAKAARNAAVSLERATDEDVMKARQADIASALAKAEAERSRASGDLAAAWKVHDPAKPWSENAMGIDAGKMASGETLRHTSDMIAVDRGAARVFSLWNDLSLQGPHDVIRNENGVVSLGGVFTHSPAGGATTTHAKYQVYHFDRWPFRHRGPWASFDYVSYGVWARASESNADAFDVNTSSNTDAVVNDNKRVKVAEANSFVFANSSDLMPVGDVPRTGRAFYHGSHASHIRVDTGSEGNNVAIAGNLVPSGPTRTDNVAPGTNQSFVEGRAAASIDFAANTATLDLNGTWGTGEYAKIFYDLTDIKLDGNMLTGGNYRGRALTNLGTYDRRSLNISPCRQCEFFNDALFYIDGNEATDPIDHPDRVKSRAENFKLTKITVHGGVFGDKAQEIAGTINIEWRKNPTTPGVGARPAFISIHTGFGLGNRESR